MSKIIFNERQQRVLEANPNVASVYDRAIQYTPVVLLSLDLKVDTTK